MTHGKTLTLSRNIACVAALLFLSACAQNPEMLVDKALDAREKAMNDRDVRAYVDLFHPDYKYQNGAVETVTSNISKRFTAFDFIQITTHNRRISFEENGEIARVVQQFRLVVEKGGKVVKNEGTEHFLLKKKRGLFGARFLFYEGLGV